MLSTQNKTLNFDWSSLFVCNCKESESVSSSQASFLLFSHSFKNIGSLDSRRDYLKTCKSIFYDIFKYFLEYFLIGPLDWFVRKGKGKLGLATKLLQNWEPSAGSSAKEIK